MMSLGVCLHSFPVVGNISVRGGLNSCVLYGRDSTTTAVSTARLRSGLHEAAARCGLHRKGVAVSWGRSDMMY